MAPKSIAIVSQKSSEPQYVDDAFIKVVNEVSK